jgi:hypothetical protein
MVQGSLDLPPLVIRSSRGTSLLLLLIAVVLVVIGAGMQRDPTQNPAIGYLEIIVFGAGIPIVGWRLIRPDLLTVTPDGITWRGVLRTVHWHGMTFKLPHLFARGLDYAQIPRA